VLLVDRDYCAHIVIPLNHVITITITITITIIIIIAFTVVPETSLAHA
jgi:hypothetical protein